MISFLTPTWYRKRARRLLLWAVLILSLWSLVAWIAAKGLIVSQELPQADAIVVLSGSSSYQERVRRAAQLFSEGRAPKILLTNDNQVSGWSNELQRNPLFIEREAAELRRAGVPDSAIEMLPQAAPNTYDEALLVREYAVAHGLRSLLVVTSAYHSRRALWTYQKVFAGSGINVGVAIVPPGDETPPPATWWLHRHGWEAVALEYPKLIYYWWKYR